MSKKFIVTNLTALKTKYGSANVTKIKTAIKAVIAADAARGFQTSLVDVASATRMKKARGRKVSTPSNPRQNKNAVDAIYRASLPEYLVLLGAPDVIPHIDLRNPLFGADDPDRLALGDLPYACEAPYSQKIQDFIGPTRVVGRIPDIAGANDPAYLLGLLDVAAKWQSRPASAYSAHLGLSAAVWKGSTTLSMKKMFGPTAKPNLIPPKTYKWTASQLAALSHFINCHGSEVDPQFYGQQGSNYPVAHDAAWVVGRIKEGTIASAECCYGAQLYDPAPVPKRQAGIANTYLAGRAYGFFGSTTIAYGPADGNGAADILCQYFLQRVLASASLGRAALEARQQFAQGAASLDPVDLKTLAQMNLLGDPSIHPVSKTTPHVIESPKAMGKSSPDAASAAAARADRRRQLFSRGTAITQTQSVACSDEKARPGVHVLRLLRQLVKDMKLGETEIRSYRITSPTLPKTRVLRSAMHVAAAIAPAGRFHVALAKRAEGPLKTPQIMALVAKEEGGQIVSYRRMSSR
jgi:hypothetical protein